MATFLAYLRASAIQKGLLGGSRPWMVIGGAAWTLRFLRRVARRESKTVFCEELEPGETVVIRHEPPVLRGRRAKRT